MCKEILSIKNRPTVRLIQNQLKAINKKDAEKALEKDFSLYEEFGFTRGKDYWGGKKNE